jgi:tRNA (adenine37-N6)-methyltransferase
MSARTPTPLPSLQLTPIGVVHSPWKDKRSAPRQPAAARDVAGVIELYPHTHYEHALQDLTQWSHLWVLFWFHLNTQWNAKVLPPRSQTKRGVFATRSPHRPNPLGLSVVRLAHVDGPHVHVRDLDILDGTPVLDIKPYVPYTDSIGDAHSGWLESPAVAAVDPGPRFSVVWSALAQEQVQWLAERSPLPLQALAEDVLSLGPTPHPYRRIRVLGDHLRLSVKDFRLRFVVEGELVRVLDIGTGYRKRVLADPHAEASETTPLAVHRAFVARFGT